MYTLCAIIFLVALGEMGKIGSGKRAGKRKALRSARRCVRARRKRKKRDSGSFGDRVSYQAVRWSSL